MNFTPESQIVKDYVLLINSGKLTFEAVPNIFNLREVIQNVLNTQTN